MIILDSNYELYMIDIDIEKGNFPLQSRPKRSVFSNGCGTHNGCEAEARSILSGLLFYLSSYKDNIFI